jgi:hypothetical protein
MGMVEFGKGESFFLETAARVFVGQLPGRQHLERHVPIESLVVRAIHDAHAPSPEAFEQPVMAKRAANQTIGFRDDDRPSSSRARDSSQRSLIVHGATHPGTSSPTSV